MGTKDSFFKELFKNKEIARQFALEFLPKIYKIPFKGEVKDIIVEDTSFSNTSLSEKESDVLLKLVFQDHEAFVYILIEHQSTVDYLMPYRLLVYMTRIWERYVKEKGKEAKRKGFKLPPIVPVVFYDGLKKWTAKRNFKEMVMLKEQYEKLIPSFEYLLIDTKELPREVLKGLNNAIGFIIMIDTPSDEDVKEFIRRLKNVYLQLPKKHREIVDMYMKSIALMISKTAGIKVEENTFKGGGEKMFTILEHRIKKDIERARKEGEKVGKMVGLKEGEKKGLIKGKRALLLKQLQRKFGKLDEELKSLIETAPIEKIEEVAVNIFDIENIDEIKKCLENNI